MFGFKHMLLFLSVCAVVAAASSEEDPTTVRPLEIQVAASAEYEEKDLVDFHESFYFNGLDAAIIQDPGSEDEDEDACSLCGDIRHTYSRNTETVRKDLVDLAESLDLNDDEEMAIVPGPSAAEEKVVEVFAPACSVCEGFQYRYPASDLLATISGIGSPNSCCSRCGQIGGCQSWTLIGNQCVILRRSGYGCERSSGSSVGTAARVDP